jgi:SOS response associated peptidase (SRAP)
VKEAYPKRRTNWAVNHGQEKLGKAKQPHYFQMKDAAPFFFAGIWDEWRSNGTSIKTCAVVMTSANKLLATIHDRMPVILPTKLSELRELLSPLPESEMQGFPVSPEVIFQHDLAVTVFRLMLAAERFHFLRSFGLGSVRSLLGSEVSFQKETKPVSIVT